MFSNSAQIIKLKLTSYIFENGKIKWNWYQFFQSKLDLPENFDTSEPINIHLEKSSPIVPSLSNPINTPESVTNIEQYDEKYDKVALNHLKAQIMRQIKNKLNLKRVQNDSSHNENIIALCKNQIDSLKSEIYFPRDEMKQKNNIS